MKYKEGMWVSFMRAEDSYGVIVKALKESITIRWMDEYYVGETNMIYFIDPVNGKVDADDLIRILPPVIAAFYEDK
jgi:hypothetical protein